VCVSAVSASPLKKIIDCWGESRVVGTSEFDRSVEGAVARLITRQVTFEQLQIHVINRVLMARPSASRAGRQQRRRWRNCTANLMR
jgi:hypothetical protein